MERGLVSVIIPSRNERFLAATVRDVCAKARGPVEVIPVLDGYWPDDPLPEHPAVTVLHKTAAGGMRAAINDGIRMSRGEWLLKCDAHCMFAEGFDEALKAECDRDWVVVPRRHRLEPETWTLQDVGKPPVDAHYLSFPFERPGDPKCGLHGTIWTARAQARQHVLVDEEMSSQGSCWFMARDWWAHIGEGEPAKYGNFIQEFQEVGLKTWLGGGKVMVNKRTWYAHLHKGQKYGRGYFISRTEMAAGAAFATRYWMLDQWERRVHDLRWLIERFAPVPTWPADLDLAFATARRELAA